MEFNVNDHVFAKLGKNPFWPARINKLPFFIPVPDGKYPVFFYGTHEVEFLSRNSILPFMENKCKFTRNSRYQYYNEAIWEIEHNPDILNLDKDPEAEKFLCDIFEIDKPDPIISDSNGEPMVLEKPIDVENAEINDVEGIMNLEECEWNEIFTIDEQEANNSIFSSIQELVSEIPVPNNFIPQDQNDSSQGQINNLFITTPLNDCRVILERLSPKMIASLTKHKSTDEEEVPTKKNKVTNFINNTENEQRGRKSTNSVDLDGEKNHSEQRIRPVKPMATINKNSVSRIVDAITIDSDDNSSCVIVSPVKSKTSDKDKIDEMEPIIKLKLVRSDSNKNEKSNGAATININSFKTTGKPKHLKSKSDRNFMKRNGIDKNDKEPPLSFDKLFNNKFSILGSGFKIAKKKSNKTEFMEEENSMKLEKNTFEETTSTWKTEDDTNDGDETLWPNEKEQYDDFKNFDIGDAGGDDNDSDGGWPIEKDQTDVEIKCESDKVDLEVKNEDIPESTKESEIDNDTTAHDYFDGSDDEALSNNMKKDPWTRYLSQNKISSNRYENDMGKSNDLVEIGDESDNGEAFDVIVENETGKKSLGNVWSNIDEMQKELENNSKSNGAFIENENDDCHDNYANEEADAIKAMEYMKDAKWLNSRNEFVEDSHPTSNSYYEDLDSSAMSQHNKWFNGPGGRSPPYRDNQMNIPIKNDPVDNGHYKGHQNSFKNRPKHQSPTMSKKSKFNSPGRTKPPSFMDMPIEQLFPPFKSEYLTNSELNNSSHSSEIPPKNCHDTTNQNNYPPKSYHHNHQSSNKDPRRGAMKSAVAGRPPQYQDNYGLSYHNGNQQYPSMYPPMNMYPYYAGGMMPIMQESPDYFSMTPRNNVLKTNNSKTKQSTHYPTNKNVHPMAYSNNMSYYNDMSAFGYGAYDYFYPPNGYYDAYPYPYFAPSTHEKLGPTTYTPASPDPEEMGKQENSTGPTLA